MTEDKFGGAVKQGKHWALKGRKIPVVATTFDTLYAKFHRILYRQLIKDIRFINSQKDIQYLDRIKQAQVEECDSQDKKSKGILLTFPGEGGLLIDPSDSKIDVFKATKAIQCLTNHSNELVKQELIVIKSQCLESFKLLDENYVRNEYGKTLSTEALSEYLLLK